MERAGRGEARKAVTAGADAELVANRLWSYGRRVLSAQLFASCNPDINSTDLGCGQYLSRPVLGE